MEDHVSKPRGWFETRGNRAGQLITIKQKKVLRSERTTTYPLARRRRGPSGFGWLTGGKIALDQKKLTRGKNQPE